MRHIAHQKARAIPNSPSLETNSENKSKAALSSVEQSDCNIQVSHFTACVEIPITCASLEAALIPGAEILKQRSEFLSRSGVKSVCPAPLTANQPSRLGTEAGNGR